MAVRRISFKKLGFFPILPILIVGIQNLAWGWDEHRTLMPFILKSAPFFDQQLLGQSFPAPCEAEDRKTFSALTIQLELNPSAKLPKTTSERCGTEIRISAMSILTGSVVDDPDHGMDQNLSSAPGNSFDPSNDRKWMGGTEGPTSQGFRHMYFGGWKISRPLATLQFPPFSIGQAPARVNVMAQKAKELIKSGKKAWGVRVLGWAMHYLQDLNQPFHSVQIVDLRIVPWNELFHWPPGEAFQNFVSETTRIVTNFHWAYEGYVLTLIKKGELSPFAPCLSQPEKYSRIQFNPKTQTPLDLANEIVNQSSLLASQIGKSELKFFGNQLLQTGIDLIKTPNLIDYEDYSSRPDLREAREQLHSATCKALANTSLSTRYLLEWAFNP